MSAPADVFFLVESRPDESHSGTGETFSWVLIWGGNLGSGLEYRIHLFIQEIVRFVEKSLQNN